MTRFVDGFGRTLGRDPRILETLLARFKESNLIILAQAGMEIEYLQDELAKSQEIEHKKPLGRPHKIAENS